MKAVIKTPTPDLTKSREFYLALNYAILSESNPCIVSDGKVLIEIDDNRFARAGITFYKSSWKNESNALKKEFALIEKDGTYISSDPNGVAIYLKEQKDYPDLEIPEDHQAIPGNFNGLSIEAVNFHLTLKFWQLLGYQISMGNPEGGWVALTNETDIGIGVMKYNMCPHLFFNPSYTFFNGKNNLKVIEEIRKSGVPITEEITHFNADGIVDNVIMRDPGGFGYFIFSD